MNQSIQKMLDRALTGPVNGLASRKGKRIRGTLLQLSYEMAGGTEQIPTAFCEAIESLHLGSLVIDDVQDGSHSRRGSETLHQQIGTPLAINAGNWMYFHALHLLSEASCSDGVRAKAIAAMVVAGKRCHEGQAIDLQARISEVPVEQWNATTHAISLLKTGTLVELSMQLGMMAAGAREPMATAIPSIGRRIGIALQMRNDLDELAGIARPQSDDSNPSAVRDDDLRNGRMTWPWVWALELAGSARCETWISQLQASAAKRWRVAEYLYDVIGSHGDLVISATISEQIRLLGEHVLDNRLLKAMAAALHSIAEAPAASAIVPKGSAPVATGASE